jgi:hypothetical protein
MRGTDETSASLFSYVDLEERIPAGHPLRRIRQIVSEPSRRHRFERDGERAGQPRC